MSTNKIYEPIDHYAKFHIFKSNLIRSQFLYVINRMEPRSLYHAVCVAVQIAKLPKWPRCQVWGKSRVPTLMATGGDQDHSTKEWAPVRKDQKDELASPIEIGEFEILQESEPVQQGHKRLRVEEEESY